MEARNITIVTTQNQAKYVVNTDATTLAELKAALRAQGIAYEGMTFYEGLSHTELLTDEAQLPKDVMYKGEPTNELVFMLTLPNKKIRSGAALPETRQALYDAIVELNLQDAVVAKYNKNFTQCKNSELMTVIEEAQANNAPAGEGKVAEALKVLVDILEEDATITSEDAAKVLSTLTGKAVAPKSPYSNEEIDAMFNFVK